MIKLLAILLMGYILSPEQALLHQQLVEMYRRPDVLSGLHDSQHKFVIDEYLRITAQCGRRGGKTTALGRKIIDTAEKSPAYGEDESIIGYLVRTKQQAKRLMWGRLQTLAKQHQIPMEFQHTDLIAKHKNGCQIWILGADKEADIDKLRGFPYRLICIDEAQAIRAFMENLIDEVLDPALSDYDGQLVLTGTPPVSCCGFFHEASTGQLAGWRNYHWTVLDNPHFPKWRNIKDYRPVAEEWLKAKRESKGWDENHPTYQREWLGLSVNDESGKVYKYNKERNGDLERNLEPYWTDFHNRSKEGEYSWGVIKPDDDYAWQYVLGVDLGTDDAFAIHAWAFCSDLPDVFDAGTFKITGETVTEWADEIKRWQKFLKPIKTVGDSGGLGKAILLEMNRRHGVGIIAAEKKNKHDFIEIMNSDMMSGYIHVDPKGLLAQEWEMLPWDEDRKKEDPGFDNHASDGGLYAFREAYHWTWKPKEEVPKPGDDEYGAYIADKLRKQRMQKQKRRMRRGA